jgi:septum formation protein
MESRPPERTKRLILASESPRRSELLERAGFEFTVTSVQISETTDENLNLPEQIRDLARRKAEACLNSGKVAKQQGNLLLSADTVVVFDGEVLGKPKDHKQNEIFLRRLSGQTHDVITAVCLVDADTDQRRVEHDTARILFRKLSEKEILDYVLSGEGLDKAGGYGIQGKAGAFVEKLEGAFDTVMGLPISLVEKILSEERWNVGRRGQ